MIHAEVLSTAETSRNTDIFDVLIRRRILELGPGGFMHLELADFSLGCGFRIETEYEHEKLLVLHPHAITPPVQGNIAREGTVSQDQTQPQAPPGSLGTATNAVGDSNDVRDTTEVNPTET